MKNDTDMKYETILSYIDTKVAGEAVIYRKLDVAAFVAGAGAGAVDLAAAVVAAAVVVAAFVAAVAGFVAAVADSGCGYVSAPASASASSAFDGPPSHVNTLHPARKKARHEMRIVATWGEDKVTKWLHDAGEPLSNYANFFKTNCINGNILLQLLNPEHRHFLKELIQSVGHRMAFEDRVRELKKSMSSPTAAVPYSSELNELSE